MIFADMCQTVESLIVDIYAHPFNQKLAQGTLPEATFLNYLAQDALFLNDFAKALSLSAARLDQAASQTLLQLALNTIGAEQHLHRDYLGPQGIDLTRVAKNPACFMYTNYVLCTSTLGSIEEAIASVLPCFWIYQIVGQQIAKTSAPNNPYHAWINMYASDAFQTAVDSLIGITNQLAMCASPSLQKNMVAQFKRATELEWLFWNDAYHHAAWMGESRL